MSRKNHDYKEKWELSLSLGRFKIDRLCCFKVFTVKSRQHKFKACPTINIWCLDRIERNLVNYREQPFETKISHKEVR